MTKVITRYFDSAKAAKAAERILLEERFPRRLVQVYSSAEGLSSALAKSQVNASTAQAYEAKMAEDGGAVVLVKAGYKPLNAAKLARSLLSENGGAPTEGMVEEVKVKEEPSRAATLSILEDHPKFFTREKDPNRTDFYMADWPIPLISKRKPSDEFAFPRHARMADFPIPLLSRHEPKDEFAFPRHARMANMLLPLTIRRQPADRFAFPRHARMADRFLPLTNRRKPYRGSLIARHARFANWPFPHLMNGKIHTNSLMPGAPRMANKPFDLISKRKPYDEFAFPRHMRMANMILPLISKRKPYTGSIVPKHGRMADFILPLLARDFRITERLGWKTLSQR